MELTNKDTKMIQGLSVIAMLCVHLFDKDFAGLFVPLVFINNIPLSFYFGQICDFCVFGFAFCSGYAHIILFSKKSYYKSRLKSLLVLLINYWFILALFSIISLCTGHGDFMPGSVNDFLGTFFLYDVHYNGAWWYMWAYVLLVLISPIILKLVDKHPYVIFGVALLIYLGSFYIRFHVKTDNYFLQKIGPFGMTLFEYIIGAIAYKIKLFSKLSLLWNKIHKAIRYIIACLLFVSLFFVRTLVFKSLIFAPISGFIIIFLFSNWKKPKCIETIFLFIGKHSTNIWLTHMFFFSTLFVNFVYIVKYPLFIFLFLLFITIVISIIIQFIEKPILKLIKKRT